jgi:hypothetical protein
MYQHFLFLGPPNYIYLNGGKKIPDDNKIYQMAVKCTKWPKNIPTFSIPRPSKLYLNGGKNISDDHKINQMDV